MFVICVVLCILLNTNDSNHLSVYDVDSRRGLFRYVSMLMLRQIRGGETQSVGFGVMETRAKMCQIILQNSQISWGICDEFVTCSKRTARPNRAQGLLVGCEAQDLPRIRVCGETTSAEQNVYFIALVYTILHL